jgi:hypothetical protein
MSTAVIIASGVLSTGGLAAIALSKFGMKNAVNNNPTTTATKEEHHG